MPIYNPSDDYWYVNGQKYKKAYLQDYVIFTADGWQNNYAKGQGTALYPNITYDGDWTYTLGKGLHANMPNATHGRGSMISGAIDLSKYTQITVEGTSNGEIFSKVLDVSGYSQTAYLGIGIYSPSSNDKRLRLYINNTQSPSYLDGPNLIGLLAVLDGNALAYGQEVCITALYLK